MISTDELSRLLPFPRDKRGSPPMDELCWLHDLVQREKPKSILEGGAGVTTATIRLAAPDAYITAVDAAEPGSEWAVHLDILRRDFGVWVEDRYADPYERWSASPIPSDGMFDAKPYELFFLDSSAGVYVNGGRHCLRTQCLFLGLALCRRNAVVAFHDAKRRSGEIRGVLKGIGDCISSYNQMEAWRLHLRQDVETGRRP